VPPASHGALTARGAADRWRTWPRPAVAWAIAVVWLGFSIGLRPLTLPEEGRYVGVAWEMLRSGDWLVPTLDGLPFFHKPPLFYWITAASMQVFGANAAAARAAPLIGALLGALGLVWFVGRRVGPVHARWTGLVLVTLPFFFGGAQFANLDLLVAGFIALSVVFAADAALAIDGGEPHRRALVAAWAAAALGVLAKGLIGLVLPGLVLVLWLLAMRRPALILRLLSPLGLAVFLLIAAPWFVALQMRYPGFAHYFFVYQHFERFAATGFNNAQPWWFFFAAVPALTLPWSPWLLRKAFTRRADKTDATATATATRQLMWTWLGGVLLFFSLPQSKPVGYAMPVLFPIAFLAADAALAAWRLERQWPRRAVMASLGVAITICLAAVVVSAATYDRDNTALARTLLKQRGAGEPVVFAGEYFFDIPLHARLSDPVAVTGDWSDPKFTERDNWRRELAEAAPFAPALAAKLLVTPEQGFGLRCGLRTLWVAVRVDAEGRVSALPGATRVATSNRASLWRVPAATCAAAAASAP
jgi:4-amino-4-deoxy-L-arabinose transferase-like glycosyltransferase